MEVDLYCDLCEDADGSVIVCKKCIDTMAAQYQAVSMFVSDFEYLLKAMIEAFGKKKVKELFKRREELWNEAMETHKTPEDYEKDEKLLKEFKVPDRQRHGLGEDIEQLQYKVENK